jgi:hypothetical protein
MWLKAIIRATVFWPLAIILLPVPTLYATLRKLDRLPWGLDYIFGCREDGWNGTGCDPQNPRKLFTKVDGITLQGWWPDYLGLIWDDLAWYHQWWLSYKWCALRNFAWNLRLLDWFSTSIHYNDITVTKMEKDGHRITVLWTSTNGKKYYFKRRKLINTWWDYGYEFHYELFDPTHPWYVKVRQQGYTFDVTPFKDRSIPSIRPRTKLK